jgi:hypothetical protein
VVRKIIDVDFVYIEDQIVDKFIKALTIRKLENLKYNLNLGGKMRSRGYMPCLD